MRRLRGLYGTWKNVSSTDLRWLMLYSLSPNLFSVVVAVFHLLACNVHCQPMREGYYWSAQVPQETSLPEAFPSRCRQWSWSKRSQETCIPSTLDCDWAKTWRDRPHLLPALVPLVRYGQSTLNEVGVSTQLMVAESWRPYRTDTQWYIIWLIVFLYWIL